MGRLGGVAAVLGMILLAAVFYPSALRPAVGPAILVYVVGFMLVAMLNLNTQAKTAATRVDSARIRYLVIGGFLALGFQVVDRLDQISGFDLEVPPIGLALTIIYLYVISQAIVRIPSDHQERLVPPWFVTACRPSRRTRKLPLPASPAAHS